jgi:subfamily B ATP-binding cassette protein MsbA
MLGSTFRSLVAEPYSTPALIRRLVKDYAAAQWKRYALAFVLMAISAGCTAFSAYLIREFVNAAYLNRDFPAIVALGFTTVALFMVKGASTYGHAVVLARISARIVAENQRQMFDKLLNENLGFFAARHSSEFTARLVTGANAVSQVLNLLITAIGRDCLAVVGLAIVMAIQDPLMTFVAFVAVPPALLAMRKMIRRIRAIARNQFTGGTRILETLQEAVQGIRIIKAFTLEGEIQKRFERSVAEVEHESFKMARVANRASPIMETLAGIAIAIVVVYGGHRIINSTATAAGAYVSFLAALLLTFEPAKRLARLNVELNSSLVGVRVLFELIDSPPTEPIDDSGPSVLLPAAARLEFRDVRFAYRSGEPVIRGMSFVAQPGKVTALVGPSGGGKSTVLSLVLRFYDAESGTIAIDGRNIRELSRRSLRRQIGYVGQHVHLFQGSIRDNIAFGKVGATEVEIMAAAQAANAHDFIIGFPSGYDTPVGEHGLQLSGGERQRVAIARALIKNASIILLDEATASLDSESERLVQDAIAHLCEGRTTIAITHRLNTVLHADCILVIADGAVIEAGRHDELLRKGGRYASFYRTQLKGQEPRGPRASIPYLAAERSTSAVTGEKLAP